MKIYKFTSIECYKTLTGTQMVLEAKNIKLNNSSKWFTFGQKFRP